MIPRLLVPVKLAPVTASTDGRRRAWTILDERRLVPAEMPVHALEAESKIPLHMPLDVLGQRTLIAREAVPGELELPRPGESYLPTDADERVAIPVDAHPAEFVSEAPLPIEVLEQEDLVTPDVFTTGQVQFMPREVGEPPRDWSWVVPAASIAVHVFLVLSVFGTYALMPHHQPTTAELEADARNLQIYLPPGSMFSQPKSAPKPETPSNRLRVDPGLLKKLAPEIMPSPPPGPVTPPKVVSPRIEDLPSAPVPRIAPAPADTLPRGPQPLRMENPTPVPESPTPKLKLPSMSPGRAIEDAARGSASRSNNNAASFGGYVPRGSGGGYSGGGGGGGEGYLGGAVQMLTPDEGVDFNSYIARVLASVRRNWYSIMPESAKLGDRGRVILDFKIMRDGTVPMPDPILRSTSTKEPLDRAAMSSIRASSPFEPLPSAFSGPYIELRFIFLYNLPMEAAQ